MIEKTAYARAGLIGNPSDGYYGKTISAVIPDFRAKVILYESPELRIELSPRDEVEFDSMDALVDDIRQCGYYGGIRLIKAAIKKFHDYLISNRIATERKNFTIRYDSDIPLRVGMAGSSAILTATMRALMEFFHVDIPQEFLPTLIMRAETEELGIAAGLQDRVIQVYGGCVYMDFDRDYLEENQHGRYVPIDPRLLPPLYVAYRIALSEGTEVVHNDLRARWERGEQGVHEAMQEFARLTDRFLGALKKKDLKEMARLMDANFDLRASLCRISSANWELINAARNVGASAKFCGSGGAIVGICADDAIRREIQGAMAEIGAGVVFPTIR